MDSLSACSPSPLNSRCRRSETTMIESEVVTQSFRATVSVTPLRPLAAITAGLVSIAVVASWRVPEVPDVLVMATPGALAAGVALGLDDEGFRFIRPVPTTALARLGLRLAVLIPVLIAAIALLLVTDGLLFDSPVDASSASVAALVAAAVAVDVWWSRHRPETAAEGAAAVVVGWSLSASVLPDVAVLQAGANWWHTHSFAVLGLSVVAAALGLRGRAA